MITPTIQVKGAWAEIRHAEKDVFDVCLSVLHPARQHVQAFKEGRWDGRVRLHNGDRFPAGLMNRVTNYLNEEGHDVKLIDKEDAKPIDTSRFDKTYLGGVGPKRDSDLWDHQVEGVLAMLNNQRGHVKVSTGGGKTEMIAAAARYFWEERGWRSIILTSKKGLAKQTRERLELYYDGLIPVGQCGDGMRVITDITCCTAATLIKFQPHSRKPRGKPRQYVPGDPELREMVKNYEVIFLDEAHHTSAESWYDIAMNSDAVRRFGLSGTPLKNKELADLRMVGATGPEIFEAETDNLIDLGLAAKPKICMVMADNCSGPELPYKWVGTGKRKRKLYKPYDEAYQLAFVDSEHHNRGGVLRSVDWLVQKERQTLVLCRHKAHFRALASLLEEVGIEHRAVWGDTPTDERDVAKQLLNERKVPVLLTTTIFDEGEDVPGVEAIVITEYKKINTNALQRIGRGMRAKRDGPNEVWVVQLIATCHPKLIEHAMECCQAYESEGYEVYVLQSWPELTDTDFKDDLLPFEQWEAAMESMED
jgi:superfamily II DNA or RNA helicase